MRVLLYPFAFIYKLILLFRHLLFDLKIRHSETFREPVICVGNLTFGGTGKTPHIEYLTRLLQPDYKVAILSRGYMRKSKGFVLAEKNTGFEIIGDEPRQYLNKFDNIIIAVDEKRVRGIKNLLNLTPKPDVILLDDAFQHRAVKAGLNILLTDYHHLYPQDHLVPAGSLRDVKSAAHRADIIIVTKTPKIFSPFIYRQLSALIKPRPHQKLYFSYLTYGRFVPVLSNLNIPVPHSIGTILMFCGIANPYPLQEYLQTKCNELILIDFPDHHSFTEKDMQSIKKQYDSILGKNKIIITTEKDAMRLIDSPYLSRFEGIPFYFVPIAVKFHLENESNFDKEIVEYVSKNHTDN
ncbi:MAG: tetraacyldisaccharide 4'-kinase [Bacteroidales bacterium]|nr:tetraacyldisaccharide 4'-kinase [Bacteroidales bacterium]